MLQITHKLAVQLANYRLSTINYFSTVYPAIYEISINIYEIFETGNLLIIDPAHCPRLPATDYLSAVFPAIYKRFETRNLLINDDV